MEYILLMSLYQLHETDVDTIMEHTGKAWFRNKVTTGLNTLLKKDLCSRETIKGEGKKFKFKYICAFSSMIFKSLLSVDWIVPNIS